MLILKFGGSSVGNAERINGVINILDEYLKKGEKIGVVFSAFQTVTDSLINVANLAVKKDNTYLYNLDMLKNKHIDTLNELIPQKYNKQVAENVIKYFEELKNILHGVYLIRELTDRTLDYVVSFGERLSCFIISETMKHRGTDCEFLDSRSLVKTDDTFGSARVDFDKTNRNIVEYFKEHKSTQIITGFISSTDDGETTTLGRGGSDYSAAIFGAALNAKEIEIWTDVNGILTADPRKVVDAFPLKAVTYEEAMELSHFGAKVIHPPTMLPALKKKIKIRIRNTFNPSFKGTIIIERESLVAFNVKGISSIDNITLVRIQGGGMIGVAGVSSRIFSSLAKKKINIILITQASSEHSICVAVMPNNAIDAKNAIKEEFKYEILEGKINKVALDTDLSIIAVVGEDMKNTPGIAGKVFQSLGKNGINIHAIAQGSSELNISLVIKNTQLKKALNVLHNSVFLSNKKTANIFLVGRGLIGSSLLRHIDKNGEDLQKSLDSRIKVVGIADINYMKFDVNGLNLSDPEKILNKECEPVSLDVFISRMKEFNLPNSVFVDCTASEPLTERYKDIFESNISVVTPNKIANSSKYEKYNLLKQTAKKFNVQFRYSTNVGAALPLVGTIADLRASGDKIVKIEGILSGTLSFIFNQFRSRDVFSEIVKEAKAKGYTEPDPRNDLNGLDFARKILLLARESGYEIEMSDVEVESLIPEPLKKLETGDEFLNRIGEFDAYFLELKKKASEKGKLLTYAAVFQNGKAKVGIQEIDPTHPFANLTSSNNIVAFTTANYKELPLVIMGPGAGAEITAFGVYADILRTLNYLSV